MTAMSILVQLSEKPWSMIVAETVLVWRISLAREAVLNSYMNCVLHLKFKPGINRQNLFGCFHLFLSLQFFFIPLIKYLISYWIIDVGKT